MTKYIFVSIAVFFTLSFSSVYAEDYKIGAVNAIRILEQSPQAEKMRKKIETEFAPRDKQLVAAQKKLKDMEDKMSRRPGGRAGKLDRQDVEGFCENERIGKKESGT